jgi:catechol 2,3-dioxygenase-like lactoylglutathione lyase family enzyme
MTGPAVKAETGWYTRPVLFVADLNRALRFYVGGPGFEKRRHEGDGAGKVCQVDRGATVA